MKLSTNNEAHCAALNRAFTERLKFTLTGAGVSAAFVADRLDSWPCELGSGRRSIELQLTQVSEVVDTVAPWAGEGLPPVGLEVEARFPKSILTGWTKFTLMYLSEQTLVYKTLNEVSCEPAAFERQDVEFRPIRTPEQIAGDARLHEIRNACTAVNSKVDQYNVNLDCSAAMRAVIEAMIDAGYHK